MCRALGLVQTATLLAFPVHQPRSSLKKKLLQFSFWVFLKASSIDCHWPLAIDSPSNPFSPPRWPGDKTECLNLLIKVVGSTGDQLPSLGGVQKSPYYYKKRHLSCSHHLGNSKGFRSSVSEMGIKMKYIFF